MQPIHIQALLTFSALAILFLPKKHGFLKKYGRFIEFLAMMCPCMYSISSSYGVTKAAILGFLFLAAYAITYWPKKNDFMKKHKVLIIVLALLCPILYATYLIWFVEPM